MFLRAWKYLGVCFAIFARDVRRLLRFPLALLVVAGICLLPSVYAWYTIDANFDPYGNTKNLNVAVANEDAGAYSADTGRIDIGADVVDSLRQNDGLGWCFVSADAAREGVESGEYYAAIVIPSDFSESFLSVFGGQIKRAQIEYYVNEKMSGSAVKVTDTATAEVEASIDEAFKNTVATKLIELAQAGGEQALDDADAASGELGADIARARQNIAATKQAAADLDPAAADARESLLEADATLASAESVLPELSDILAQAADAAATTKSQIGKYASQISTATSRAAVLQAAAAARAIAAAGTLAGDVSTAHASAAAALADARAALKSANAAAEAAGAGAAGAGAAGVAGDLASQIADLTQTIDTLQTANNELEQSAKSLINYGEGAAAQATSAADALAQAADAASSQTAPKLESALDDIRSGLLVARAATDAAARACTQIRAIIAQVDDALSQTATFTGNTESTLDALDNKLSEVNTDITALQTTDLYRELQAFLKIDATDFASFLAAPVSLNTQVVYPVSSYGASVAPFFSNVALWVACFLLMAIVKLRVEPAGLPAFTQRQAYFARLMFFLFLGVIQATFVAVGDLAIGVQCANVPAFFAAMIIAELVYVNLMYALEYSMRHVGRAIAVVLLVMQIPGSNGMYPIQMLPQFYQNINPLLPFTYSIDAMREAIGGFYGANYAIDLAILVCVYVPLGLAIGLIGGSLGYNLNLMFDKKLGRTDLFVAEKIPDGVRRVRTRARLAAILDTRVYGEHIRRRSAWFSTNYRRAAAGGWILLACVLAAVVVIAAVTHADANAKLNLLAAYIDAAAILALYQVVLLYYKDDTAAEISRLKNTEGREGEGEGGEGDGEGEGEDEGADEHFAPSPGDVYFAQSANYTSPPQPEGAPPSPAPSQPADPSPSPAPSRPADPTPSPKTRAHAGFWHKALAIYRADIRQFATNAIALVVAVGLAIVPPMYAWLTTLGFWDPYANTGNLSVAVVNQDAGYTSELFPTQVNAGDRVVATLHENSSFKWEFVNYDQAMEGVDSGKYYAAIVIPSDFSRDILSALGADATRAQIDYYVNQKLNPIAPHITGVGATTLQTDLDREFTATLTSVSLGLIDNLDDFTSTTLSGEGEGAGEGGASQADSSSTDAAASPSQAGLAAYVSRLVAQLKSAADTLGTAGADTSSLGAAADVIAGVATSSAGLIQAASGAGDDANEVIGDALGAAADVQAALSQASGELSGALSGIAGDYDTLKDTLTQALSGAGEDSQTVSALLGDAAEELSAQASALKELAQDATDAGAGIDVADAISQAANDLSQASATLNDAKSDLAGLDANASSVAADVAGQIDDAANTLNQVATDIANYMSSQADAIKNALEGEDARLFQINNNVSHTATSLASALTALGKATSEFADALKSTGADLSGDSERIGDVAQSLQSALDTGDVAQIKEILGQNTDTLANFLSAPTELAVHEVYPIANNGSSMSAFYTSLSLWIGAIFLVALTETRPGRMRIAQVGGATPRERYVGRYLTFATLACVQGLIVSLGNLFLIGVQCVHPLLYVAVCVICALVFSNLVYTLTISFSNIGKAVAILLLVMQLAGAGGIFPIQLSGQVFQAVYPWLPFSHSMEAMQSCIAGIYGTQLASSLAKLCAFLVPSLLLGLVLRTPIIKANDFLDQKLEATGILE